MRAVGRKAQGAFWRARMACSAASGATPRRLEPVDAGGATGLRRLQENLGLEIKALPRVRPGEQGFYLCGVSTRREVGDASGSTVASLGPQEWDRRGAARFPGSGCSGGDNSGLDGAAQVLQLKHQGDDLGFSVRQFGLEPFVRVHKVFGNERAPALKGRPRASLASADGPILVGDIVQCISEVPVSSSAEVRDEISRTRGQGWVVVHLWREGWSVREKEASQAARAVSVVDPATLRAQREVELRAQMHLVRLEKETQLRSLAKRSELLKAFRVECEANFSVPDLELMQQLHNFEMAAAQSLANGQRSGRFTFQLGALAQMRPLQVHVLCRVLARLRRTSWPRATILLDFGHRPVDRLSLHSLATLLGAVEPEARAAALQYEASAAGSDAHAITAAAGTAAAAAATAVVGPAAAPVPAAAPTTAAAAAAAVADQQQLPVVHPQQGWPRRQERDSGDTTAAEIEIAGATPGRSDDDDIDEGGPVPAAATGAAGAAETAGAAGAAGAAEPEVPDTPCARLRVCSPVAVFCLTVDTARGAELDAPWLSGNAFALHSLRTAWGLGRLRVLALTKCAIDDACAEQLVLFLAQLGVELNELDLSRNSLSRRLGAALGAALGSGAELKGLRKLRLGWNNLGSPGAAALLGHLAAGRDLQLEELDLPFNGIGDAATQLLRKFFEGGAAPRLRRLDLSNNRLLAQAGTDIAAALPAASSSLRHLLVGFNKLGFHATVQLIVAASKAPGVAQLGLDNSCGDYSAESATGVKVAASDSGESFTDEMAQYLFDLGYHANAARRLRGLPEIDIALDYPVRERQVRDPPARFQGLVDVPPPAKSFSGDS